MQKIGDFLKSLNRQITYALAIGFMVGVTWLLGLRLLLANNNSVHYHANIAIYVDGQQLKLQGPGFYEEVSSCGNGGHDDPAARVHLHNNVATVVHVHDHGATWGHLFENIGYSLTDKTMVLDDQILTDGQNGKQLTFWLNGKAATSIANHTIQSEDILLIDYGQTANETLQKEYQSTPRTAHQYNLSADPSACTGSKNLTFSERLKRAFSVNRTE